MTETEIKIPVSDLPAVEDRIRARGFTAEGPPQFERNTLYDTSSRDLFEARKLLRVREAGDRTILTVKLPPVDGARHKVREEREVEASDAGEMHAILAGLGYQPAWRYEKRRTTYRHSGEGGLIEVDDTPIADSWSLKASRNGSTGLRRSSDSARTNTRPPVITRSLLNGGTAPAATPST